MPLFGPPNIEKLKAKRDVEGLTRALGYQKDHHVRSQAAQTLGEIRDARAVDPLIAALKNDSMNVRTGAAGALGEIGDSRALEPLIAALNDESDSVRERAAWALGKIGDSRALEPLIVVLRDEHDSVRITAARALGVISDVRALEPLIATLKDKDENDSVRLSAASALGELGDARAVRPLIATLEDASLRRHAADALDELGWKPTRGKPAAAYWIARKEWDKCVRIGTRAVEPLIAALNDKNELVRLGAARALGEIGDSRAVESLIVALGDKNESVRTAAVELLVRMYRCGGLDAPTARLILSRRERLERHADFGNPDCIGLHSDERIRLEP